MRELLEKWAAVTVASEARTQTLAARAAQDAAREAAKVREYRRLRDAADEKIAFRAALGFFDAYVNFGAGDPGVAGLVSSRLRRRGYRVRRMGTGDLEIQWDQEGEG